MTEYIDKEKLLQKLSRMIEYCKNDNKVNGLTALFQVCDAIMDCPTADVQEVVRCKNCKFFDPYDKVEDFDGQCVVRDCETDKEEFCSYGSKRGDEK